MQKLLRNAEQKKEAMEKMMMVKRNDSALAVAFSDSIAERGFICFPFPSKSAEKSLAEHKRREEKALKALVFGDDEHNCVEATAFLPLQSSKRYYYSFCPLSFYFKPLY